MLKKRMNKVLSSLGIASRRNIENMIRNGNVSINHVIIYNVGYKVDVSNDIVHINGKFIDIKLYNNNVMLYYVLNKPYGFISTTKDEYNRLSVLDLISVPRYMRLYPIGRLDYCSEGVLLLTNDGKLTNHLLQYTSNVKKVYLIKVRGIPLLNDIKKLEKGVLIKGGDTRISKIFFISTIESNSWFKIVITCGYNHHIRQMFWHIKHPVIKIVRISFAGISMHKLPLGNFRSLTQLEIRQLKNK